VGGDRGRLKESIRAAMSYPFLVTLVTAPSGSQTAMNKLEAALFSQSSIHQCIRTVASHQAEIFQKKLSGIRRDMLI